MILARDLTVHHPDGRLRLQVDHFEAAPGAVTAVLGAAGSGKTTLLRALCLLDPAEASVHMVNQVDALRSPSRARRSVGFVADRGNDVGSDSVVEHLGLHAAVCGAPRGTVEGLLELTDLEAVATRSVRRLSPGERKRLDLARVLLHDPAVLFLDEPCASLDAPGRRDLQELCAELARLGRTVVVSARVASDLGDRWQRQVLLDRGRVADRSAGGER